MTIKLNKCIITDCNNIQQSRANGKPNGKKCNTCNKLLSKYGITTPERDNLIQKQNNLCLICKKIIFFTNKLTGGCSSHDAVVDHCHATGKVRGILCGQCNLMLGNSLDNELTLLKAVEYLKQNKEKQNEQA